MFSLDKNHHFARIFLPFYRNTLLIFVVQTKKCMVYTKKKKNTYIYIYEISVNKLVPELFTTALRHRKAKFVPFFFRSMESSFVQLCVTSRTRFASCTFHFRHRSSSRPVYYIFISQTPAALIKARACGFWKCPPCTSSRTDKAYCRAKLTRLGPCVGICELFGSCMQQTKLAHDFLLFRSVLKIHIFFSFRWCIVVCWQRHYVITEKNKGTTWH